MSPRYLLVFQNLAADRRAMYDFPQITKITLIGERYETVTQRTAAQTGKGAIPGGYTENQPRSRQGQAHEFLICSGRRPTRHLPAANVT